MPKYTVYSTKQILYHIVKGGLPGCNTDKDTVHIDANTKFPGERNAADVLGKGGKVGSRFNRLEETHVREMFDANQTNGTLNILINVTDGGTVEKKQYNVDQIIAFYNLARKVDSVSVVGDVDEIQDDNRDTEEDRNFLIELFDKTGELNKVSTYTWRLLTDYLKTHNHDNPDNKIILTPFEKFIAIKYGQSSSAWNRGKWLIMEENDACVDNKSLLNINKSFLYLPKDFETQVQIYLINGQEAVSYKPLWRYEFKISNCKDKCVHYFNAKQSSKAGGKKVKRNKKKTLKLNTRLKKKSRQSRRQRRQRKNSKKSVRSRKR